MKKAMGLLAVGAMAFAVSAPAQKAPEGPPKPGPEVKKLAYNIGTWKTEGEAKAVGMMPAGKISGTSNCGWYTGGFFVMCREEGTGPMGTGKGISFLGYDPNEKVYTFHEFTSGGEAISAKGTIEGDTWHWTAQNRMGDDKFDIHVTIKQVSKTEYTFKLEMSKNGGEFTTVQETTSHKVTPAAKKM